MFDWLFGNSVGKPIPIPERVTLYVGDDLPSGHIPVRDGPTCVQKLDEYGASVAANLYKDVAVINLLVEAFRRIHELAEMVGEV